MFLTTGHMCLDNKTKLLPRTTKNKNLYNMCIDGIYNYNNEIPSKYSVVVSRYNRNVDWVYKIKGSPNIFIYDKQNPTNKYNIPVNKGNEASVYLKYIIDHYDTLSEFTFFTHDEEYSWHHSGSIIDQFDRAVLLNKLFYNINDKIVLGDVIYDPLYKQYAEWYKIYIDRYIPLNKLLTKGVRGCAQFLVHKNAIRLRPRQFYENLYNWIITTPLSNWVNGRFMEWTWHLIFTVN